MTTNNLIDGVDVHENMIEDTVHGIFARASDSLFTTQSPGFSGNRLENLTITDNVVLRAGESGISVWGAWSKFIFLNFDNTIKRVSIQGNHVLTSTQSSWASGFKYGVHAVGGKGEGAVNNRVSGILLGNLYRDNASPYYVEANESGAMDNQIDIELSMYIYLPFIAWNMRP